MVTTRDDVTQNEEDPGRSDKIEVIDENEEPEIEKYMAPKGRNETVFIREN